MAKKDKKIKNISFIQTRYICVHGAVENLDGTLDDEILENYIFMKLTAGYYLSTPRKTVTQRATLANLKSAFPSHVNDESMIELTNLESKKMEVINYVKN